MARPKKKRYGNLVPRTSSSPFANRLPALSLTKNLREQMEKELLKRKLARFQRAEMASRGLPAPVRGLPEGLLRSEEASDALAQIEAANKAAASITQPFPTDFTQGRQGQGGVSMGADYRTLPGTLPRAHGQGDFPGYGAELNQRGMKGEPWVMPQDKRKILQQQAIARDLAKREAEQLELQNRRPAPEQWMTGRLGLQDPTWTSKAPGADSQQAANMAETVRRQREIEAAAKIRAPRLDPWMKDFDSFKTPTAINVPPKDPRRVAEQAERDRLAAATLPADHGQDDPEGLAGLLGYEGWTKEEIEGQTKSLSEERYRRAMLNSVNPTAPSQENLEGTIYGDPSTGQKVVAEVLGVTPDIIRRSLNSLMMFFGAPEDDEGLIETDPTAWILKKLQENPRMIGRAKDFLAEQFAKREQVYPAVKEAVTETIPGVVQEASQAVGDFVKKAPEGLEFLDTTVGEVVDKVTEGVPPLMGELQQWAEENIKPVTKKIGREFDRRYALKQEGADAIARGPDDPGLLTDSGRAQPDAEGLLRVADREPGWDIPPSLRPRSGTGRPTDAGAPTVSRDYVPPAVATKEVVAEAGKDTGVSTVGGSTELDPATRAGLERVWGKHTYNPAQRRKQYMSQLKNIYQKAAWLDAIAAISGGKSRSSSYIDRAVGMMDAMQKFDQEERVYNIWRDVYYDKDGNYDPPKSKKEAAERARRLGANPEETKSIYGWAEEGQDLQQWYRPDGKGGHETTTVKGKKSRPDGEGWIMGKPPAPRTPAKKQYIWAIPPGQTEAIYMDKDVVASQQGWTQSSIDKSGGLYGQSLRQAAQILKDGGEDAEGKARAILRQFYSRDHVTAGLFPENIDKVIDSLIESIRVSSGSEATAQQQTAAAAPATLEDAVAAAIAHPSNAGKNPQEVRFDVEVWWQKNRGGG